MTVAIARDVARWSARLGRDITAELEPMNAMIAGSGPAITAAQYVDGLDDMSAWSRAVSARSGTTPTCSCSRPAPNRPYRSACSRPDRVENLGLMADLVSFTSPFDLTGQPAISLPLHWNADGLPIGVQLVARYGREDVLLRLAAQLEAARPWADRRPPVSA